MISHKHQCIFIHIPKCAGTSVENVLGHFDGHNGRGGQDHRSIRMIQAPVLTPYALSNTDNIKDLARRIRQRCRAPANPKNAEVVTSQQYQQYFKFTFVRNPWMRAHSWYKNAMRDPIHQRNYGIPADIAFPDFIEQFAGKGFLRPQTYWLKDFRGRIAMDYIGRFESLAEDFAQIKSNLGLGDITLPHKIASQSGHDPRKDFTTRSVDLIARHYAEEIQLFGYQFE